ncbi:M16 family metallopeptidase [Vibrio anguillarum]|uniref:M16 family metallopeptidase n=1 Tax=Vibrio anguillarum TaxID=55601 RepID=UPI00188A3349|nr:insulinase family protein [Vibrio anguillarum]MBF4336059.1 insulinase family protein [Vibrio anguillarum]
MRNILFFHPLSLLLLLVISASSLSTELPKSHRIHEGQLENGLRYQLVHNTTPAHAVIMRMRIAGGSLVESEQEQGLMHLLEHMAFKGSDSVAEGEMIRQLERLGLSFGSDTNAVTQFNQTVYEFNIAQGDSQKVATGLGLMREIADRLKLEPKALDQEKPVVVAEWKERNSADVDNYRQQLSFLYPRSPLSKRLPIGDLDVVKHASSEQLRSLYQRFYTPERTTIIVVGDLDVAQAEEQIKRLFSNWVPHRDAVPLRADHLMLPAVRTHLQADAFFDARLPTQISLGVIAPQERQADSVESRHEMILESILSNLLYQRLLPHLIDQEGITNAFVHIEQDFGIASRMELSLVTLPEQWRHGLTLLEQTVRQAIRYGFNQSEIDQAIKAMHADYQQREASSDTLHSFSIAQGLVTSDAQQFVPIEPTFALALFEAYQPQITAARLHDLLTERWQGKPWIYLSGPYKVEKINQTLLDVYEQSQKQPVEPYQISSVEAFAYREFGEAGTLVHDKRDPETGIRMLKFANGVKLNIKPTELEKNVIYLNLSLGFGEYPLPRKEGIQALFNDGFVAGGLEQHSFQQLIHLFSAANVTTGFNVGTLGFASQDFTNQASLDQQLALQTAFLTSPGWREEGMNQFRQRVLAASNSQNTTPEEAFWTVLPELLHPDDPRFRSHDEELLKRHFSELAPVFASAVDKGLLEIAIVGDLDEEKTIQSVAKTLGALPRHPEKELQVERVEFPSLPASHIVEHQGSANAAALAWLWPTTDKVNAEHYAKLMLLEEVLSILLTEEVREKAGASYSPYPFSSNDFLPTGFGYLGLFSVTDTTQLKLVEESFDAVLSRVKAEHGIDADLLQRAKQPLVQWLDSLPEKNAFWLDIASLAQTYPHRYSRWQAIHHAINQVNANDLRSVANQYLQADKQLSVKILPNTSPTISK